MAAGAQQKEWEWIWEFFLRSCTKDRMIRELMDCVPFPEDNLKLRRLLLLRMLSLQVSEGIVNEETLELLRGHGVLCRFMEARKEGWPAHSSDPAFPTLSKAASRDKENKGDDYNSDAAALPPSNQNAAKRTLLSYMDHRSTSDSLKDRSEPAVGIRDWMKGRALPRSNGAQGGANAETEMSPGDGKVSSAVVVRPVKQWELEQAVMVELTVKHLRNVRADAGNKVLFEQAAAKYWGNFINDSETWDDEADRKEMVKSRNRIRSELRPTEMDSELMEKVLKKYTKDRVESVLKPHLDREWSIVGQTFLERVSSDIVNGKYNPVNGRSPWQLKATGIFSENADYGRESGCRTQTIEKPGVRASRGKFSRSREKSQKKFTIWDLDDGEDREEGDGRAGSSSRVGKDDGNAPVSPTTRKRREIDVRARRLGLTIEEGIARALEFEEPGDQPSHDEKHVIEGEATIRIEETSEDRPDTSNAAPATATERHEVDHNGSSPAHSGKLDTGILSPSDAVCGPIAEEEPDPAEVENQFFQPSHSIHIDGGDAELRSDVEIVDKENIVPPAPRESLDPNQNPACFNAPPWGSAATLDTSEEAAALIRKRKSGISAQKDSAATQNSAHIDEVEVGENCTIEELDTAKAWRTSQSEQTKDAEANDPLSNVQPSSRSTSRLFERNASAHTKRWNEDEIESEPDSPSAPKRLRLSQNVIERRITPLVGITPSSPSESSLNMGRQNRRKRRRWSDREVSKLKEEVEKCGKGRWKYILERNPEAFEGRTEVDLKDKWRNLEKYEGMG